MTVEYGQPWSFSYHGGTNSLSCANFRPCSPWYTVKLAGQAAPFADHVKYVEVDDGFTFGSDSVNRAPLPIGKYVFTATQFYDKVYYTTPAPPVTLTVVPAKLAASVDVETDPNHTSHAILSATATGKFITTTSYYGSYDDDYLPAARVPAGTWKFEVKDGKGGIIHSAAVTTAVGAQPYASAYWTDPPAGQTFTVTASFVPSGSTAGNFAVTGAAPVSYTATAAPVSAGNPASTTPAERTAAIDPGTQFPLWAAGTWGILILALVIALLVLAVRLTRSLDRDPTETNGPTNAS
ncbi:MAG TPA: hypothetical protein VGM94_13260 [Galbitalea sp.]